MIKNKKRGLNNKRERLLNIPNPISLLRIILSFFLVYIVIKGADLWTIAIIFAIAALTDALDGFLARKLNMVTNFGRRLDIIADRILMISIVITLILYLQINSQLTTHKVFLLFLIMSREIISTPFFVISLFMKKGMSIPHVRWAGKITTILQGVSFPLIVLGWDVAFYFVILTMISGIISGFFYAFDSTIRPDNKYQKKLEEHYKKL
jgi:CDP-diacylglycerol--glycerol-3-phosphate 3-phosphatidyltransferase